MVEVFDFFSGCGGTSLGFQNYGFRVIGALDYDKDSAETFRNNFPKVTFIEKDIRQVKPEDLSGILMKQRKTPLLFCACAPCQPFTGQRRLIKENDSRKSLLSEFERFVRYWKPDFIFLENVPGIQNINKSGEAFSGFTELLEKDRYNFDYSVIKASEIGVPQVRKRFILTASSNGRKVRPIKEILEKYSQPETSVKDWIADLPAIKAGERHQTIPNHAAFNLSEQNLIRIQHTPEGGDRRDWPEGLRVGCHKNYQGHTDVYGRMKWDEPASTLTTRCISYSNGRFGHPEQHRAISVREAARLQTFPDDFVFYGNLGSCARQVGNAVPPLMAQRFSESFI
ncbi:DNA cytosine methyltransferase [Synechococcus sp. PCC 7336]|uniref:DNA cytosine methyltransferase n=1 Tax=Synechococcus sp. PCC 7336 TaxID=195250 RepID=UPI00034582BE|nr:DNA cytosine methyltransferase [Synechococcus sp. PCC 7336]